MLRDYIIATGDEEEYHPYWLRGPDVGDIKSYCNTLLPEAARRVYDREAKEEFTYVTNTDILETLVEVLKENGFEEVNAGRAYWSGVFPERTLGEIGDHIGEFYGKIKALNKKGGYDI